jgi:oligopeptidase B
VKKLLMMGFVAGMLAIGVVNLRGADDAPAKVTPPVAKKIPKTTQINGVTLVDNYAWMREKSNPEVKAYLEGENAYTEAVMKPTEGLQKKLYGEMLGRIKETDVDVPYREGDYFYYSRTEAGKQYPIYCRKKGSLDGQEEVMLDVNEMAKGQKFMAVGARAVSEDGNLLAYTTDNTGFRQYTLGVKDLRTGKVLADHAERVDSVEWAADNKTIFYSVEDPVAKRSYQVYQHTAGTAGADKLIYEEKDERFDVYVGKTRSGKYLLQISSSHTTSEARYLPADQPAGYWKLIEPRKQDVEYYPDHNGSFFYIRTNDTGRNFRLVKAPVSDPRAANWKEVLPQRADVMLDDVDFFKNYYVLSEREGGLPQLRVVDLATGASHRIAFPEPAYAAYGQANRVYDTTKFRYGYQSFITPSSVFDYDMAAGTSLLLKQREVPGGYDRAKYQVEQLYAAAPDFKRRVFRFEPVQHGGPRRGVRRGAHSRRGRVG